jgi:hypothetical protein
MAIACAIQSSHQGDQRDLSLPVSYPWIPDDCTEWHNWLKTAINCPLVSDKPGLLITAGPFIMDKSGQLHSYVCMYVMVAVQAFINKY